MAVLRPAKVIIDNYPEDSVEYFGVPNNPEDPAAEQGKFLFKGYLYRTR